MNMNPNVHVSIMLMKSILQFQIFCKIDFHQYKLNFILLRHFLNMKKITLILLLSLVVFAAKSQTLEVGGFVGGSYYIGDINPVYHFQQTSLAYGIVARYNLNSRWTMKLNGYKGVLKGDDLISRYLPDRSLEFTTELYEIAGIFEFNFLPYFTGSIKNFFSPYIFGGVAFISARPQIGNSDLRDYGTEGQFNSAYIDETRSKYSYFNLAIPFGIGIKYSFSKRVSTSLEWGLRKTFTDYLDDISTTYYLPANQISPGDDDYGDLVRSDPNTNHLPMQQRGYSKYDDWYSFAGLTITYKINLTNRNKCSEFQQKY